MVVTAIRLSLALHMNTIQFAVIGCGHIGKRHAEMIVRNPYAALGALIDIKPKEALGLDQYNVPFFDSPEAFFASGINAEVINIATPNGLHAQQAIACLEAGKHVVIEKPIALRKTDAESIILKARSTGKQVFCVMQNRYSPPSVWIKEMIESGRMGKIFMVHLDCFWNRDERYYKPGNWHGTKELDGGTLFTQFSHFIDIMYWLFGDIANIRTRVNSFSHGHLTAFEDCGSAIFDFKKGGMGTINFSTCAWDKNMESSITVLAEHGAIKIGGQYMDELRYCHVKDYTPPQLAPSNPGNDYGAYKGSAANHHFVIDNVVEVLNNKNNITTNAYEGMMVVDIIERIYQAV